MKPLSSISSSPKHDWSIAMRAIADTDLPFLARLYASTRADEMRQVDWPQQQVDDFLKSQFDAQHAHYQQHYPAASFDLIMLHGEPIGRLYIDDRADEIRIIDIALLPEYRGHGIGSDVLIDILHRAARDKKCIRIHVEHFNPAMRLYKRLGFVNLEDRGVYAFMEWKNTAGIQGDSAHG